ARRVAVLTGAGVSAARGLATFRGAGGLWRGRDPVSLAKPGAFAAVPFTVWGCYHERRGRACAAEPDGACRARGALGRERPATVRGAGGLWRGRDPMSLATPEAFADDPFTVWEFYNERRRRAFAAEPNAAHRAIVELAAVRPTTVITQNVDRLHRRAGSVGVL